MSLWSFHAQSLAEREQLNRLVVRPFYEQEEDYDWTDVADHLRGPETFMHRLRERALLRSLRRPAVPGPALDLGCGSGLMLRHLPAGSVGVDLNPRNVRRAARYAPHARVIRGDAERLDLPDASFSTVLMTEVLEHLVFPALAVREAYRVLKPGGVLIGSVPRVSWVWRLRRFSATCSGAEPFHHELQRRELAWLLRQAPFRRIRIRAAWWLLQFFFIAEK